MVEEIWAEKPDPKDDKYWAESSYGDVTLNIFTGEYFDDEDVWLEKLKAHIEWLQSYIDANQLIVNQFAFHDDKYWWKGMDLNEMQEKAEKWDEAKRINIKIGNGKPISCLDMAKKLEAIKTYTETEFKAGYLIKSIDILKILETKG